MLRTSILDHLCGPLCDAVLDDGSASGQEMLEHLEQANLFLFPLDDDRHWYRYHGLFAELLRQRLQQAAGTAGADGRRLMAELHRRAGAWYGEHGLPVDASRHAAAARNDARAPRLAAIADSYPATAARQSASSVSSSRSPIEPLSARELQVLRLIAQGLSNRGIGRRLMLAVNTVKGHNRNIFGKLQVRRRTEAVARARELGLI